MKFQVNRDVFSEAVSFAVKLLPQRNHAADPGGCAHPGERRRPRRSPPSTTRRPSQTEIQADVEEPGTVLVSGRLLAEIAGRLPNAPVRVADRGRPHLRELRLRELHPAVDAGRGIPVDPRGRRRVGRRARRGVRHRRRAGRRRRVARRCHARASPACSSRCARTTSAWSPPTAIASPCARSSGTAAGSRASSPSPRSSRPAPCRRSARPSATRAPSRSRSPSRDDRELIAFSAEKKTVTSLLIKGNFPPVRRLFPEQRRQPRGHEHRRPDRGHPPRRPGARARGRAALQLHDRRPHPRGDRQRAGPGVRDDRRASSPATTPSCRSSRSSCSTASAPCTREFVRISFTKTENPNKPGPVLITSQSSRRAGRRRHVPLPAAAQPPAALNPSAPSRGGSEPRGRRRRGVALIRSDRRKGAQRDRRPPLASPTTATTSAPSSCWGRAPRVRRAQRAGQDEPRRGDRLPRHARFAPCLRRPGADPGRGGCRDRPGAPHARRPRAARRAAAQPAGRESRTAQPIAGEDPRAAALRAQRAVRTRRPGRSCAASRRCVGACSTSCSCSAPRDSPA